MRLFKIFISAIVVVINLTACGDTNPQIESGGKYDSVNIKITSSVLMKVKKMRIFFGHQSVGENILEGIEDLQVETAAEKQLYIYPTRDAKDINKPGLYHTWVGSNSSPESKINDFKKLIESGIGNRIDVALLKFCFIDFNQGTNISEVFEKYGIVIQKLKQQYPQVTFVHMTVPLISDNMTIKDWIKKILGRSLKNDSDNIVRNRYNELLRSHYQNKEPIFDIAKLESTYPDSKRHFFTVNEKIYEAMVPAYTDDGGHLNLLGRKHVASAFLFYLSKL